MRKPPYTPESLGALYVPPETETEPWKPPPWPKDCPKPGIIEGASYGEYAAWPAVNATALKHGSELSPKHMRQSVLSGTDTPARKFGRAVHCRLLEPDTFAKRFLIAKPCCEPLKSGKRQGEACGLSASHIDIVPKTGEGDWYCGKHKPDTAEKPADFISQDEAIRIEEMVKAVYAHPSVALMRQHGGCEVSLVWSREGLPCKARLDKLIVDAKCPDTIIDIKKLQAFAIDEESIRKSIANWYYDQQAHWYVDGVKRVLGVKANFVWVFMEDAPPYDVCPVNFGPRWRQLGEIRAEAAFRSYRHCVETGSWPGVASDIVDIEPQKYLMERYGIR